MGSYKRGLGPDVTARRDPVATELDEEIRAHLDMRTEQLVSEGMSREEARAEALRRFGEERRARRRLLGEARRRSLRRWLRGMGEALTTDVRLSVRQARREPGFFALALVVFAGGVGLTTAMVTLADHVLLRPLPFPDPDELVALWSVNEQRTPFRWVSMTNWIDWVEGSPGIERSAIYSAREAAVSMGDEAFYAVTARVTGGFFPTLGGDFVIGRSFTEDEAQAQTPVAVVSEGFWARVLGAPRDLSGVELVVDGWHVGVVGVRSRGSVFPSGTEIWLPLRYQAGTGAMRNNINYEAVARIRDGVPLDRIRDELDAVAEHIRITEPEAVYSWGVGVRSLRSAVVGDARSYLLLLSASVGFLLLVTSANLAGLSLARARKRAGEVAVHLALGAGRLRLVGRVVVEHVLLALVGGTAGVALASVTTGLLTKVVAGVLPRVDEVTFDARVAVLGIAAALVAGLLAGVAPALAGSRRDLSRALSGVRGRVSGGRGLPGAVLVGGEIALAVSILVSGGLLYRSFRAVVSRDLGFDPTRVVTADVTIVGPKYGDADARRAFWEGLATGLQELPRVGTASVANAIPTSDGGRGFIDVEGLDATDLGAGYRVVSPGYFETLGVPLLQGRDFDARDGPGTERVTVVSKAMADRYWPGGAVGQRVRARSMESYVFGGQGAPWLTVIGVVGDVRQYGFESDKDADMYVLYSQVPYYTWAMTLVAKARPGAAAGLEEVVRSTVRDLDPGVPVEVRSLEARLAGRVRERRLVLGGLGVFGSASLALVCLGIYGLMSFAAGERRRELAVRTALGARPGGLVRLMLTSALVVVAAGSVVGIGAAVIFSRLLTDLLVDVGATDPASYAGSVAVLAAVAMGAALLPSLRAAREDPLEALRTET